jgi:hypothetical protein
MNINSSVCQYHLKQESSYHEVGPERQSYLAIPADCVFSPEFIFANVFAERTLWGDNKKSPSSIDDGLKNIPGNVLLSHDLAIIVSSALESLTSVFEMGTGVTPPV